MLRSAATVALYVIAAFSLLVGAAQAQKPAASSDGKDAEARALFEAGSAAYAEGRYDDALGYFNRSYQLSNRPKLLYNIGSAADRLRHDREALAAFKEYLLQTPDAPNRVEVENRIRVLQRLVDRGQAKEQQQVVQKPVAPAVVATTPAVQPAQAATTSATPAGSATQGKPESQEEEGSIVSKWWFWTAAGVVVTGLVVGIAVAASGGGQERQGPLPGSAGIVVSTLRLAP